MAYTRVNWKDFPSTDTPITAANLNKMDAGIEAVDAALTSKANTSDVNSSLALKADKTALGTQVTYTLSGTTLYITTK